MKSQFVIAAPNSNAGKTTVTLGLLRLLLNNSIEVQPFKVGPDYIDPKFHKLACKKTGVNLDLFMVDKEDICRDLEHFGKESQVNCIEGVMGLFDGADKAKGSTAELAKLIKAPVILVVDAKSVAYSVAPLLQGFKNFDPELKLLGVIFNRVGSESHFTHLKEACDDVGMHCFGYLKGLDNLHIASRHLGLDIDEIEQFDKTIDHIADELEQTVNWQAILEQSIYDMEYSSDLETKNVQNYPSNLKFAVAHDEAFNFIYPQTIKAMQGLGTVSYFSPLRDSHIPDADFVYLPGGYPECHLKQLSENHSMLRSIKEYATEQGRLYGECGGMMYLGQSIIDRDGKAYDMAGVFDFSSSMEKPGLHLGYRSVQFNGLSLKGHEFHYTSQVNDQENSIELTIMNAKGVPVSSSFYGTGKARASYVHLYLGNEQLLTRFIDEMFEESVVS
ncbi:MAG: cobyrinate a,c-diamide synthase [Cytophagales bacterium]|nr:cobyrinate a,c-diamide synthase [Cytophagales bacterium]